MIGDYVLVEKSGEIIPQVVKVVESKRQGREKELHEFAMPKDCPICGEPVVRQTGEVAWRCVNSACPAKIKAGLKQFASRPAMRIEGLGESLIEQLIAERLPHDQAGGRGEGEKSHQHAQAAARLDDAELEVADQDGGAVGNGRLSERLQDVSTGVGREPLEREAEQDFDAVGQRDHVHQEQQRRRRPAEDRPAAEDQQQSGQERHQGNMLQPLKIDRPAEHTHQRGEHQQRKAGDQRRPGISGEALAAHPQQHAGEDRHEQPVRVLRVVQPRVDEPTQRWPEGPKRSAGDQQGGYTAVSHADQRLLRSDGSGSPGPPIDPPTSWGRPGRQAEVCGL